jgi:hypothetical protein
VLVILFPPGVVGVPAASRGVVAFTGGPVHCLKPEQQEAAPDRLRRALEAVLLEGGRPMEEETQPGD